MNDQTTIEVPYRGKNLTFIHPAEAGNYYDSMKAVDKSGLLRPTSAQILALLHGHMQKPDLSIKKRFDEMPSFWTATEYLLVPKEEGIFVYDNIDGMTNPDVNELRARLSKKDPSVRFVQYGFKTENQTVSEYCQNPLVVAHFGEDSLGTLEKVIAGLGHNTPILTAHNQPVEYRGEKQDIHTGTIIGLAWGQDGFNLINDPLTTSRYNHGKSFGLKKD